MQPLTVREDPWVPSQCVLDSVAMLEMAQNCPEKYVVFDVASTLLVFAGNDFDEMTRALEEMYGSSYQEHVIIQIRN